MLSGLLKKWRFNPFLLLLIFGSLVTGSWNTLLDAGSVISVFPDAEESMDLPHTDPLKEQNYSRIFDLELPEVSASVAMNPSSALQEGVILKPEVNLRSAPSLTASILKQVNAGDTFFFTSAQKQAEGLSWLELELGENQKAWVGADFVQLKENKQANQAKPSVAPASLHLDSAEAWLQASEQERLLSTAAMLGKIFQNQADEINQKNLLLLANCIFVSARETDLKSLQVYELATACSMALGWR